LIAVKKNRQREGMAIVDFWHTWLWAVVLIGGALVLAPLLHGIVYRVLPRLVGRTQTGVDDSVVRHTRRPASSRRCRSCGALPSVVVSILAVSVALMTFPTIRQTGASLLASAGLACSSSSTANARWHRFRASASPRRRF